MAEKRRSGRGKGVPNHPLVEALASDPSKPPERATKLFGFPGPAADADTTRLWLDADLTTYVDVPNDAIIHSQTLENDQGTVLWVDPAAKLTYSSTQSHEVQAEFLGGSIAERNLGAATPAPAFMEAFGRSGWPASVGPGCPKPATGNRLCHTWVECQTPVVCCPPAETDVGCPPSNFAPCPPVESVDIPCPQPSDDFAPCQTTPRAGCAPPTDGGRGCHTRPGLWCDPHLTDVPLHSHLRPCHTTPNVACIELIPTMICFSVAIPCITRNCP